MQTMEESPSVAVSYVLIPDTPLQARASALIMGLDMGLGPQPPPHGVRRAEVNIILTRPVRVREAANADPTQR